MGLFGPSYSSHGHGHRSSSSGFFGSSSHHRSSSHHSSRPSFFRGPGSSYSRGSSSYYKRRPRDGYINRLIYKIKMMLRNLYYYARRHPMKFFMMVIMPLISSGALVGVARQFGIRLPGALGGGHGQRGGLGGGFGSSQSRHGYYGSEGYGRDGIGGVAGGLGSLAGGLGGVSSMMKVAKMFT